MIDFNGVCQYRLQYRFRNLGKIRVSSHCGTFPTASGRCSMQYKRPKTQCAQVRASRVNPGMHRIWPLYCKVRQAMNTPSVVCKPGRIVLDPQGRRVEIIKVEGDDVTVKLGGSYGATVKLPRSTLRPCKPGAGSLAPLGEESVKEGG
jgi:hypothetical protein